MPSDEDRAAVKYDLDKLHRVSRCNHKTVPASATCGCYFCLDIYPSSNVKEFVNPDKSGVCVTALCPSCLIDSVLPDSCGAELTVELLSAMYDRWFGSTTVRKTSR